MRLLDVIKEIQISVNNRPFIRDNWDILIALALFTIFYILFFNFYIYSAMGDTISYINIARAYASGNVFEAVNACWSPLFSWLMVPFLFFSSNLLYAVYVSKLVSYIIGFFTIISIRMLYNKFEMDQLIKRVFLFSIIPLILYFSLIKNTPDLLVVLILFYYLSLIFDSQYSNKVSFGILCGFTGVLAYITKSYLFFYFILHFLIFNVIFYKKSAKDMKVNVLKNLIFGLTVFFIISGIWIGMISDKYDKFTISTAGEYNQAIMGPDYMGHHPVYHVGLIEPPGKFSTSIWDEPSFINIHHWSPFSSWENFEYQLRLIVKNIVYAFVVIESFIIASIVIIISSLIFIFRSRSDKFSKNNISYLLLTIFIYIAGYTLINVEWRYFFFIFILVMFIGFYLVSVLFKNGSINSKLRNVLLILLIVSFVIQPSLELILFSNTENSSYNLSIVLRTDYGIQGNIASQDNWEEMVSISYYLNSKYYGLTKKTDDPMELQRELKDNNIDYYFVWNKNESIIFTEYKEITVGKIENLRIYAKLK